MREAAVKHLAELNWEKKLIDQLGDEIQKSLKMQRTAFQFTSFCADFETFISLVINVESRLFNLGKSDDDHFLRLKLENQLDDIRDLKVWMDARERVISEAVVTDIGDDNRDTFQHFIDEKKKSILDVCLVMEEVKHLETVGMIINTAGYY